MTEMEICYKDILEKYMANGRISKRAAGAAIKSIEKLSPHQCFEIIMVDMLSKDSNIDMDDISLLSILWYANMMNYSRVVTGRIEKVSAYNFMKLALVDLMYLHGDNSLMKYILDLDCGKYVALSQIKSTLMNSSVLMSNLVGMNLESYWDAWSQVANIINLN